MTIRERIRHRLTPDWYPAFKQDFDSLNRHRLGIDDPPLDPNGLASIAEWGGNSEEPKAP